MAVNKKNKPTGTMTLLIGAVGFGIAAALLSYVYLKAREAAILESLKGPEPVMRTVVVANRNLPRGTVVADGLFAIREIPAEFVHTDVIYPHQYENFKGRALTTDLDVGRPLLKSFLDEDFPLDFSDTIPVGRRAMTVTVDEVNSVAGFVRPGNYIDILVNIPYSQSGFNPRFYTAGLFTKLPPELSMQDLPGGFTSLFNLPEDTMSELLAHAAPGDVILPVLQNMRVLATGTDPYRESLDKLRQPQRRTDTNFTSVTLDVSPEQAALLVAAQDKGDLLAILRNRNDESAASFSTVSARDLFSNAAQIAVTERERASRAAVAAGVDASGNLVDANGKRLLSRDQLEQAGFRVNEDGQVVDKDGNVVNPEDIIIGKDGQVMTRQQLAAAGLSVNESGQIIDKNGNIVSTNDVVVAADGTVMTREQLAAAGLSINESGEIVDSKGRVISPDEIIVTPDGKVVSKQQLAAAGLSVDAEGRIVDKDGNVVDPQDLVVAADGNILTAEQLAAAGLRVNENGELVDEHGRVVDPADLVVASDGTVVSRQQLAAAGLSIDEQGRIVDARGNVVDADDLLTTPDGRVVSKRQLAAAGLSVNENGEIVDAEGRVVSDAEIAQATRNIPIVAPVRTGSYDMVIGGSSTDGVAKTQKIVVNPEN